MLVKKNVQKVVLKQVNANQQVVIVCCDHNSDTQDDHNCQCVNNIFKACLQLRREDEASVNETPYEIRENKSKKQDDLAIPTC